MDVDAPDFNRHEIYKLKLSSSGSERSSSSDGEEPGFLNLWNKQVSFNPEDDYDQFRNHSSLSSWKAKKEECSKLLFGNTQKKIFEPVQAPMEEAESPNVFKRWMTRDSQFNGKFRSGASPISGAKAFHSPFMKKCLPLGSASDNHAPLYGPWFRADFRVKNTLWEGASKKIVHVVNKLDGIHYAVKINDHPDPDTCSSKQDDAL